MASPVEIESLAGLRQLLEGRYLAVVTFYRKDCAQSQRARATLRGLPGKFAAGEDFRFVEVDAESHQDICQAYEVTKTPTILVYYVGQSISRLEGSDFEMVRHLLDTWSLKHSGSGKDAEEDVDDGENAGGDTVWNGAEIPRGYGDITEQVEARGCELLNADEGAGPVRVLFDKSLPSALGSGKGSSKDWVQSGSDDQMLLFVPLHSTVKLHTLQITSLPPKDQTEISRPKEVRLFINRIQNMDFDEAERAEPAQTISLTERDWNKNGTTSISLRFVKFIKTSSLIIFIQQGEEDAESVRIDRVRLIGEAGVMRKMQKLQKVGED